MDTGAVGRFLMVLGIALLAAGAVVSLVPRMPWLGRLPGDFSFGGPGWRIYVPLGTSLALSFLLSFILWLFSRK